MQTRAQRAQWLNTLQQLESEGSKEITRTLSSSFNPDNEELHAVPRPRTHAWPSIAEALRSAGCSGVMTRLPLFWQVEAPLFEAARDAQAFIFVNEADNMPLGMASLQQAHVDAVIATAEDANRFFSFLLTSKATRLPHVWIAIHPIESMQAVTPRPGTVFQELHILPGLPAFTQCSHTASVPTRAHFHLAEQCALTEEGLLVKSEEFPFVYPSTLPVTKDGACACGKELFRFHHA